MPPELVRTAETRFWSKVYKPSIVNACWMWQAGFYPAGYGSFWHQGRSNYAHRFAFELFNGPIAEGFVVDHLCRNRACVNPDHLRVVTHRENILADGSQALAAANAKKQRCPKGHQIDGRSSHGRRFCRICRRVNDLRRYHERRNLPRSA